jgi:hypothetical protein
MSEPNAPRPSPKTREAQHLSTARLFGIVLVFLILAAYSIWNSDRFQSLFQGVSEQRLSELLQRQVSFRRVDFRIFPPQVQLADVHRQRSAHSGRAAHCRALTIGGGLGHGASYASGGRAVHFGSPSCTLTDGTSSA